MILFCLSYAGGSSSMYFKWRKWLNPEIQIVPIELKGRGKRINEKQYENINLAIEDIYTNIKHKIEKEDYAIYGHSLGALIAFELYYKILEESNRLPVHIFFSACNSPNCLCKSPKIHMLPDDEFKNELTKYGGTPVAAFDNKEIMELFIPIIKNDIRIFENYVYKEKNEKIKCEISVLNGKEDYSSYKIHDWETFSKKRVNFYEYKGNHFFVNSNVENIVAMINSTLKRYY